MRFSQHFCQRIDVDYDSIMDSLRQDDDVNTITVARIPSHVRYAENLASFVEGLRNRYSKTTTNLILVPSNGMMGKLDFDLYAALIMPEGGWTTPNYVYLREYTLYDSSPERMDAPIQRWIENLVTITDPTHFDKIQWNSRRRISNRRIFYDTDRERIYDILDAM